MAFQAVGKTQAQEQKIRKFQVENNSGDATSVHLFCYKIFQTI